jgi:hypothetical protein
LMQRWRQSCGFELKVEVVRQVIGGFLRMAEACESGNAVQREALCRQDAADAFHERRTRGLLRSRGRFRGCSVRFVFHRVGNSGARTLAGGTPDTMGDQIWVSVEFLKLSGNPDDAV